MTNVFIRVTIDFLLYIKKSSSSDFPIIDLSKDVIQGVQTGKARRIVPYHTKCGANYSEVDACLPGDLDLR